MAAREDVFTNTVTRFVEVVLDDWCRKKSTTSDVACLALDGLVVRQKEKIPSGRVPYWQQGQTYDGQKWAWESFLMEVDVLIARTGTIGGDPVLFPLVAIENKVDGWLQSREIDTKNAVYSALKEQYPCLMTCWLMESNEGRKLADNTLLRNGRHFDLLLTEWTKEVTQPLLKQAIEHHLDYAVGYWKR